MNVASDTSTLGRGRTSRNTDVGTEILVVDVCGFLASPSPFTPFSVTTSHVRGEPPLPTSIPCGFVALAVPPTTPIPGIVYNSGLVSDPEHQLPLWSVTGSGVGT